MRRIILLLSFGFLVACEPVTTAPSTEPANDPKERAIQLRASQSARQFVQVVETVEPIAERECRRRTTGLNCDFQIVVDDRPNQPPNAFQTIDRFKRPVIAFNLALIAQARNADELAFVMGHEASHHILDHIEKTRQSATVGAVIFSGLAALGGANAEAVKSAEQLGAAVGARTYSKEFELEADMLGTIIAAQAGFDPVKGAAFFARIPDPGDKFLGSHPPNAARQKIVRDTAAQLVQ